MDFVSCSIPNWFSVSEVIIQAIFVAVTLLIALYSYKVYRISGQRSSLLYSLGFFGVSFGYVMQVLFHIFFLIGVSSQDIISSVSMTVANPGIIQLSVIPVMLGMIATLAGFATMAYVTLKEKNIQVLVLLFALGLLSIITPNYPITYHLAISVFLAFITFQYYKRHERKRTFCSMAVYLGFGLVLLGTLQLAIADMVSTFYISGHFVALVGYLSLLWSLVKVVRK